MLQVAVVEDEQLFRELLGGALTQSGRVTLRASLDSVPAALASPDIARCDVVIMDIDLGGQSGIELSAQLRARHPQLGIMLLSNHAHLAFARSLIHSRMTGWGYLLKKSVRDLNTVLRALEAVHQGQVVLDPQLARADTPGPGVQLNLTPRQRELWALLTQGYSNAAIAQELGLSTKWIDNALGGLYGALEIDTRDTTRNARVSAALRYAQEAQQANLTILE